MIMFGLLGLSYSVLWTKLITVIASTSCRAAMTPFVLTKLNLASLDHSQKTTRAYPRSCFRSLRSLEESGTFRQASQDGVTLSRLCRLTETRRPAGPVSTALLKFDSLQGSVGAYGEGHYVSRIDRRRCCFASSHDSDRAHS